MDPNLTAIIARAYDWYQQTGQHLGKFDSSKSADSYAVSLHNKQEKSYK
jgi:hypothetical protein